MILLSIARVLKFALQDFVRNFWVSLVTVIILVLSLFSINFLIAVNHIGETAIKTVEDKIDLSLYLNTDAAEEDISALKRELESVDGVAKVEYISKAQALESFQAKNRDNKSLQEALREIGKNPLNPSLAVQAKELTDYEKIIGALDKLSKNSLIESKNFDDHKNLLTSLETVTSRSREIMILISCIFIAITILVVFNAVRIAIYTHKKEIGVMKLVGASNSFIRAPFLVESILYSLIGVIGVIAIFYPFIHLLQPYLGSFFNTTDLNLVGYFNSNFLYIFGSEFLAASFVNVAASSIAVGKYVKV
ncbi:MAG: permease-like cell division protein FtsX [Patescibacteria group bacterium]